MAKITATQALIAFVVLYGGYRVVKTAQKRKTAGALPPAPEPKQGILPPVGHTGGSIFTQNGQLRTVDWRERGSTENILAAAEEALEQDGHRIASSHELAYATGARLWPGASIHPSGLDAVRSALREHLRWEGAPDTPEFHEACVRMRAKAARSLADALEVYDGSLEPEALQDTVASSVFPDAVWPPSPDDHPWRHEVWRRCGVLAQDALAGVAIALGDSSQDVTSPITVPAEEPPEDADAPEDGDGESRFGGHPPFDKPPGGEDGGDGEPLQAMADDTSAQLHGDGDGDGDGDDPPGDA